MYMYVDHATTYSVGAVFPPICLFHFRKDTWSVLKVALSVLPSILVSCGYSETIALLKANIWMSFGHHVIQQRYAKLGMCTSIGFWTYDYFIINQ